MSRHRSLAVLVSLSLLPAVAAGPVAAQDAELGPPEATPNPVPLDKPAGDGTGVRLSTDEGDILIGLFTESAPVATENFVNLTEAGFYDGIGFHRIVPGFVIQGGDPEGTGRGGPGYTIEDEEVVGEYGRGIVAMARTPAPDSQGSQFFIVTDDDARAALDSARTYVIIGRVLEGMDTVDAIVERGPASDLVEDPVRITKATIEQVELPEEPDPPPPSVAEAAGDALAGIVPTSLAGLELQQTIFTSDRVIGGREQDPPVIALGGIAEANDADLEALAIVSAGASGGEGASVALVVVSLPGVPAAEAVEVFRDIIIGPLSPDAELESRTIAGHEVTLVRAMPDAGWQDTIHVIESGEQVWFVVTDFETIEQVIDELPIAQ